MKTINVKELLRKMIWLLVGFSTLGSHIKPFIFWFVIVLFCMVLVDWDDLKIRNIFQSVRIGRDHAYTNSLIFGLCWIIWAFVSLIWAEDVSRGIYQLQFFVLGFLMSFILLNHVRNGKDLIGIIKCVCFFAWIENLVAWFEIITGRYLFISDPAKIATYENTGMPLALFDNTNDFATYLSMITLFAFICITTSNTVRQKIYYIFLMLSSVFIIFKTGSKANLIGLLLAFGVLFLYGLRYRNILKIYCAAGIFFILVLILNIDNLNIVFESIKNMLTHQYRAPGSSYSVRINLILNSLIAIKDTWGLGVGVGGSQFYMRNYATYPTYNTYALHNFWLEIFVDYGLLFGILFVVFYFKMMLGFLRDAIRNKGRNGSFISLGFLCCLVQFCMGSLSSSSNLTGIWIWVFFALFIVQQKNICKEVKA